MDPIFFICITIGVYLIGFYYGKHIATEQFYKEGTKVLKDCLKLCDNAHKLKFLNYFTDKTSKPSKELTVID